MPFPVVPVVYKMQTSGDNNIATQVRDIAVGVGVKTSLYVYKVYKIFLLLCFNWFIIHTTLEILSMFELDYGLFIKSIKFVLNSS